MNDLFPKQSSAFKEPDEDSVLAFLSDCHALEGALVRAGITRPGLTPGTLRPDWNQFARHMADKDAMASLIWLIFSSVFLSISKAAGFLPDHHIWLLHGDSQRAIKIGQVLP